MDAVSFLLFALGMFFLIAAYPAQRVCKRAVDRYFERAEELHQAQVRAYDSYRATLDMQQAMENLLADVRSGVRLHAKNRQPMHHRTNTPGFVYILSVNDEYYKIGMSQDVRSRVMSLQVSSPYKIEVVHVIATQHAPRLEVLLQSRYDGQWTSGEWFRLNKDDVATICAIKSPVTLADLDQLELV